MSIQIIGKTKVYDNIQSDYKIVLNDKEEAQKQYKLIKAFGKLDLYPSVLNSLISDNDKLSSENDDGKTTILNVLISSINLLISSIFVFH